MPFNLPTLPYDYTALEPYIDTQTMHLHHEMHHKAYVTKLNDALKDQSSDIIQVQRTAKDASPAVRNNGGGHYNHSLFWRWMAPVGTSNTAPCGLLKENIECRWGSVDAMKQKFSEAAISRFGSGWAWLGVKPDGSLDIVSTANQDNPLMEGLAEVTMTPILGLDVWEHAYYLKYQNRRPEYIEKWWNVVNWDSVVQGYEEFALKGQAIPI
jgi:Fe-Mn family superoxide dismutase